MVADCRSPVRRLAGCSSHAARNASAWPGERSTASAHVRRDPVRVRRLPGTCSISHGPMPGLRPSGHDTRRSIVRSKSAARSTRSRRRSERHRLAHGVEPTPFGDRLHTVATGRTRVGTCRDMFGVRWPVVAVERSLVRGPMVARSASPGRQSMQAGSRSWEVTIHPVAAAIDYGGAPNTTRSKRQLGRPPPPPITR
jgi:hypothetical protein